MSAEHNFFFFFLVPGLRREDLYDDDYADVQEAIRRLPEHEKNLRLYRLKRALDLTIKHAILPREQWTKPEEVQWPAKVSMLMLSLLPHLQDIMYLKPYLEEVVRENNEQKLWEKR